MAMLDGIASENGEVMADRVLAHLRKAFNWKATRDDGFNPLIVKGMARTKPRERARDRKLSDEELRDLWTALDATTNPEPYPRIVKALLLTGQRVDCAVCHGAPGVPKDGIAQGMYPTPPDLAVVSQQYTAPQLFWILRHGIKMTGMPSWSDHSDDDLWAIVAFLKKLPTISEGDYAKMFMSNMAHGMTHHHGGDNAGEAAPSANPSTSSP